MSARLAIAAAALTLALGGCTYDYLQRTDRVGYSAGDAVRANLERETTDPQRRTVRSVSGLGKNGNAETAAMPVGAPVLP